MKGTLYFLLLLFYLWQSLNLLAGEFCPALSTLPVRNDSLAKPMSIAAGPFEPSYNDLIITEIMVSPAKGQPEYIELYNRSNHAINLSGLKIADQVLSSTLEEYYLPPRDFVVLLPKKELANFTSDCNVIGVSKWPTLNNDEDRLIIINRLGKVIFSVHYNDSWYKDKSRKTGFSLEMIDTRNPCSGYHNWTASENPEGGSPGKENLVSAENPDLTSPKLAKAIAPDSKTLMLCFSEKILPPDILNLPIELKPEVQIQTVIFDSLDWDKIEIHTLAAMNNATRYQAKVGSAKDCAGNLMATKDGETTFSICKPSPQGGVLFNEIMFGPKLGGAEFVELYNALDHPVNFKNWSLISSGKSAFISKDHFVIEPGELAVLTPNPEILIADFPNCNRNRIHEMRNMPTLINEEGYIVLTDSLGIAIDSLYYTEKMHMLLLKDNRGVSLERISVDLPTNDTNNWKSAASHSSFGTPGTRNSQLKIDGVLQEKFSVSPLSFSPEDAFGRDHAEISYDLDSPGFIASISVYNRVGQRVKVLARNETLGTSGSFRWDGFDDFGKKVGSGYYVILVEAFDLEGRSFLVRKKVAVAY